MADTSPTNGTLPITVYWRPGCPFCMTLDRSMKKNGLEYAKRNIWEEPEAAAFVRSVADGNEVVPTVTVGSHPLVNPSVRQILQLVRAESGDPLESVAPGNPEDQQAGPLGKLLRRILTT